MTWLEKIGPTLEQVIGIAEEQAVFADPDSGTPNYYYTKCPPSPDVDKYLFPRTSEQVLSAIQQLYYLEGEEIVWAARILEASIEAFVLSREKDVSEAAEYLDSLGDPLLTSRAAAGLTRLLALLEDLEVDLAKSPLIEERISSAKKQLGFYDGSD